MKTLLLLVLFNQAAFSQTDSLFRNDKIKYDVVFVSPKVITKKGKVHSQYYIKINLSEFSKDSLKQNQKEFWIERLNNEESDWATNLILYSIYRKDAIDFRMVIKNRNQWLAVKQKDIAYWKSYLK